MAGALSFDEKIRQSAALFWFGLLNDGIFFLASRNPNQNRAALWRIFLSNESALANRKTGFYADRDPNKQEVGFILHKVAQNLKTLIKYSRSKIKN